MEMDKEFSKKELEKQMREAELKDKILRRKEKLENYVKETTKNFGFKDKQGSMSDKEFRSVENLLKPGEDPKIQEKDTKVLLICTLIMKKTRKIKN
jgi:hypothetical protein